MAFKVFLDTDVIIDFLIDRQPHTNAATLIFELCENGIIEIYTSSLCVINVHYVIKRVIGEKKAREVIHELLYLFEVLEVSKDHLISALKSDFKDFEDALQHYVR